MSEMVEKVARAIGRAMNETNPEWILLDDGMRVYDEDSGNSIDLSVLARTAIAAMREPTAKMVDAGYDEENVGYAPDGAPAEYVWRAMIDAALAEDELS